MPVKSCGTVQAVPSNAANTLPPGDPLLIIEQKVTPVAVVVIARLVPATAANGVVSVTVIGAKGVIVRLDPVGQESMKPTARVKTLRTPRGVSKVGGTAAALLAM